MAQVSKLTAVIVGALLVFGGGVARGSDAERAALASISDLDDHGRLAQVSADDIQRLGRSTDQGVRKLAAFYSAKIQAQKQPLAALKQWKEQLDGETSGTELWAMLKLAIGNGMRTAESPDLTGALLSYQDILTKRPQGAIAFKAAVASGDAYAAQNNAPEAEKAYRWALSLLERDHYIDVSRVGIGPDALRNRIAGLHAQDKKAVAAEDRDLFRRAEENRLKGDWLNAIKLYRELMDRFPTSNTIPPATWGFGDCLLTSGRLENAIQYWSNFASDDYAGPWRAQALVSLADVFLERRFDLAAAKDVITRAGTLYDACTAREVPGWKDMGYSIFQRQGLLAYIANKPDEAITWFSRAAQLNPPQSFRSAQGNVQSGLNQLIDRLRRGESLTPPEVRAGRSEPALILLLADIHQAADDLGKAEPLYRRVVENDRSLIEQVANATSDGAVGSRLLPPLLPRLPVPKLNPTPVQLAWATYQLGRIAHTRFEFTKAIEAYRKVGDAYKECPWADAALVRAGILYFSNLKKPGEALSCFSHVVAAYPSGSEAQRAAMYIGMIYSWGRNYPEAVAAYQDFLKRYPQSPYAKAIADDLLPKAKAQLTPAK